MILRSHFQFCRLPVGMVAPVVAQNEGGDSDGVGESYNCVLPWQDWGQHCRSHTINPLEIDENQHFFFIESTEFIEWFGLEESPKPTHPNPRRGQGRPPPAQAAQGPIQPGPERLQGRGTTASPGSCASASPPSE